MSEIIPHNDLSIGGHTVIPQTPWIINPFKYVPKKYFEYDGKKYIYNPKNIIRLKLKDQNYNLIRALEKGTSKPRYFIIKETDDKTNFIPYIFKDVIEGNPIPQGYLEELIEEGFDEITAKKLLRFNQNL